MAVDHGTWTPLTRIKRVGVVRCDGAYVEFDVAAIVSDSYGRPLWFVHYDEGREVINPWTSSASITVLDRHE